jgi:hypothetical protein
MFDAIKFLVIVFGWLFTLSWVCLYMIKRELKREEKCTKNI